MELRRSEAQNADYGRKKLSTLIMFSVKMRNDKKIFLTSSIVVKCCSVSTYKINQI